MLPALVPPCSIPLIGSTEPRSEQQPPQLIDLQTHFEEIIENWATGANLAVDMKQPDVAIRDLWTPWCGSGSLNAARPSLTYNLRSNGSVCLGKRFYLRR